MSFAGMEVMTFGSGGKAENYVLSNLYQPLMTDVMKPKDGFHFKLEHLNQAMQGLCPFLGDNINADTDLQFASLEAIWQGLKSKNWKTFLLFTSKGKFGGLNSQATVFQKLYGFEKAGGKLTYWSTRLLGGMVCKLVSNPTHGKKLGLKDEDYDYAREFLSDETERAIWMCLLKIKYTQNQEAQARLLATKGYYLLEAARVFNPDDKPYWGGKLIMGQNQEDTHIQGNNKMGLYLMQVRASVF
jgi:hypothetical protein